MKGTYGSPVLTAISLSAVAPFVPWYVIPLLAPGVYLTFSFTCFIGVAIATTWMMPQSGVYVWSGLAVLLVALLLAKRHEVDVVGPATFRNQRLFEWTPRGDSTDGWWSRLILDRLMLEHWWTAARWLGHGPGHAQGEARKWGSRGDRDLLSGECHCDVLQHVYEYGLLGLAAVLAFCVPIVMNLRIGDPWSAAWLVLLVVSAIHYPARHPALGLMWLAISARLP